MVKTNSCLRMHRLKGQQYLAPFLSAENINKSDYTSLLLILQLLLFLKNHFLLSTMYIECFNIVHIPVITARNKFNNKAYSYTNRNKYFTNI